MPWIISWLLFYVLQTTYLITAANQINPYEGSCMKRNGTIKQPQNGIAVENALS